MVTLPWSVAHQSSWANEKVVVSARHYTLRAYRNASTVWSRAGNADETKLALGFVMEPIAPVRLQAHAPIDVTTIHPVHNTLA